MKSNHASYGWIIDVDHVTNADDHANGLPSRVGWTGPRTINPALEARLQAGEGVAFRLYSDYEAEADNLDYEGRILIDPDVPDEYEAEFGPLDDLGRPDCGSTTIKYQNAAGAWEHL